MERSVLMPAKSPRALVSLVMCGLLAVAFPAASVSSAQGTARDCPHGGTIRFGVEPYEDAALLAPAYQPLADALGQQLNCNVELNITTNYTAEIEAMRSGKLDIAEFGPLAYYYFVGLLREAGGVSELDLAPWALKRARTTQEWLQGTANRRQGWSMPRCLRIRAYARKGLAGSSSTAATSSKAVGVPRSRSSARKP